MTDTMASMDIAFPNLGIYLENVPQYIYIGGFGIAIYGIMIALGMILGILMATRIAKRTGQDADIYWDMSIWVIIFALIGARIYYVIFFWDAYKSNLMQIFNVRAGGLAIYGGVIAGVIAAYVYSVIKKLYLPEVLDTLVYGLLVGQIIGRWGNFFNREVFGEYTDNILAMRLPIDMVRERDISDTLASTIAEGTNYIQVHPTFLYESLWNLALLIFLLLFLKHRRFKGQMFLMYLAGYGIGRAWIEYIRTDQLYIPGTTIPVNMVMAIVLAAVSVVFIIYMYSRRKGMPAVGYGTPEEEKTPAGSDGPSENADDDTAVPEGAAGGESIETGDAEAIDAAVTDAAFADAATACAAGIVSAEEGAPSEEERVTEEGTAAEEEDTEGQDGVPEDDVKIFDELSDTPDALSGKTE